MMDKKQQMIDSALSYGGGGACIGWCTAWQTVVANADDITRVVTMIGTILGVLVMAIKFYYDMRRIHRGRKK